ncbi:MAG: membrane protein insertase YidC [Phycisphaerales bacterium]
MNFKKFILVFSFFIICCGNVRAEITAVSGENKTFTLGSTEKGNPYKLELTLTTKGAGIEKAAFRDFNNRDRKSPKPFVFLSPVDSVVSLQSKRLMLPAIGKSFPLDRLNWVSEGIVKNNGSETISFSAVILQDDYEFLKLTKIYTLRSEDYSVDCEITLSNLSKEQQRVAIETLGPAGVTREDLRTDMRTVTAGFVGPNGLVEVVKSNLKDTIKHGGKVQMVHKNADYKFLWTSVSDKYFTSIIRPVPAADSNLVSIWSGANYALSFDPDIAIKDNENIGVMLDTQTAGIEAGKNVTYKYQVYIGPKDKDLFKSNPLYKQLGFIHTIDFQACCGLGFGWLSFAILQAMDWMHEYIPNYGVIIIIFVLLVRLVLHPVTKKSQVSMMRMSKLGPMAEEIKKKYGDNKAEMQKHMAALYKEHGIAPMLGCLPMVLQMPIWVALYSAINTGIEFRGAAFLPFWITDLSLPDSLFTLPAVVEQIPLIGPMIGTGFNVLPILLGVAMFAQQKLMPSSSTPSTNPQMAQQQKMMLWMMPMMMLIFLYRAPSGLNLYIMASTAAGVVEQYVIRKHIREREALEAQGLVPTTSKLGGKLKKKKPKPPIKFS